LFELTKNDISANVATVFVDLNPDNAIIFISGLLCIDLKHSTIFADSPLLLMAITQICLNLRLVIHSNCVLNTFSNLSSFAIAVNVDGRDSDNAIVFEFFEISLTK